MREYLEKTYSVQPVNDNPEIPFRIVFFRIYDRKIASGEISFSQIKMDKDQFICLSTAQDPEMSRDDIINLCINMKLTKNEADDLMISSGYEKVQK